MAEINEWAKVIHDNSVAHGWWDEERSFGETVALCHSELSEAIEAYRDNQPLIWYDNGKPEGIATEMIDCVIRIFDWCGKEGVDVESLIRQKHMYNCTRPWRHGGKRI